MAEQPRQRGPQMLLPLMLSIFCVSLTTLRVEASLSESHESVGHRQVSTFVRRNLEGAYWTRTAGHGVTYDFTDGGMSRVRRLAGSANCSVSPSDCSNRTNFPGGAQCCLKTGRCADLNSDKNNCGSCGFSCPSTLACCGGVCVSTMSDNSNCGTCGVSCKSSLCSGGLCGYSG